MKKMRQRCLLGHELQISRGDRVLEIGCGWGSFALHAAYGARITGQTTSRTQYESATRLLSLANLAPGSAQILLQDYRQLNGQYDKLVSTEMFEAVGLAHLRRILPRVQPLAGAAGPARPR